MAGTYHQAGCCCADECEYCSGRTPRVVVLTVSGITFCGCLKGGTYDVSGTVPGTIVLTQESGDPCDWQANAGTLTRKIYEFAGCTGDVTDEDTSPILWDLRKNDANTWTLIGFVTILADEHYHVFFDVQTETDCLASETWTNDWVIGDCGNAQAATVVYGAYGGTATK